MGFSINTLISSGDEEYVVVVTVPADADAPSLSVDVQRRDGYCRRHAQIRTRTEARLHLPISGLPTAS